MESQQSQNCVNCGCSTIQAVVTVQSEFLNWLPPQRNHGPSSLRSWHGLVFCLGVLHVAGCLLITQVSNQMLPPRKGLLVKAAPPAIVLPNQASLISSKHLLGSKMFILVTCMSSCSKNGICSMTELCQGHPVPLASSTHGRPWIKAASHNQPSPPLMLLYCASPLLDPLPLFPCFVSMNRGKGCCLFYTLLF